MTIAVWLTHPTIAEWTLNEAQSSRFAAALPGHRIHPCRTKPEFLEALREADVALVWRFKQEWFAGAPRLRRIGTPAAGHEYLDITPPAGVTLHFGTFHGAIISETVLALMLGLCRGVLQHACDMREPSPQAWPRDIFSGQARMLRGSHVVLLGFGSIGQWIARSVKPLGARVTGIRRNPAAPRPRFLESSDRVLGPDALDEVLPEADHLVLALPSDSTTARLLDRRRLALLPRHAFLYNVGRGNAIDEQALSDALREQRIAAAALDVFATEPLPEDSPLRSAPQCYLYPHSSAIAPGYLDLYLEEVIALCNAP